MAVLDCSEFIAMVVVADSSFYIERENCELLGIEYDDSRLEIFYGEIPDTIPMLLLASFYYF